MKEANAELGRSASHQDLLTTDELRVVEAELREFERAHDAATIMDAWDLAAAGIAGLVGGIIDLFFVGIPSKELGGRLASLLGCPTEHLPKGPKAPFDKVLDSAHGALGNHRSNSVSHHTSVGGFIRAVRDVLDGTSTHVVDGKIVVVENLNKGVQAAYEGSPLADGAAGFLPRILSAIGLVLRHWQSDANTSLGLPGPWMLLAKFLEVGSVPDGFGNTLTIAELATKLYSGGMDLRRFVGDSVTVAVNEVLVRLWAFGRTLYERGNIQDAVASLGSPRTRKMLATAHLLTAASNAGVVHVSGNPLNLNLAQWTAAIAHLGRHAHWALVQAPREADHAHRKRWTETMRGHSVDLAKLEERLSDATPVRLSVAELTS
ncbi:MAG: hypothetical protein GY884_34800 [Proteobacteria bacterium]|nr:hypothetical protein [Pseudomonadota bacterium]